MHSTHMLSGFRYPLALWGVLCASAVAEPAREPDYESIRWRAALMQDCQVDDRQCLVWADDLLAILQPHPRQAATPLLAMHYEAGCSDNHLTHHPLEVTDQYLLQQLADGELEKPLAYLLINLRVATLRPSMPAASLFEMALDAVRKAQDVEQPAAQLYRQVYRLLALVAHNHSLEISLLEFTPARDRLATLRVGDGWRKHYYGRFWRSELASTLRRVYRLLGEWQVSSVAAAMLPNGQQITGHVAGYYWSGAMLACELRSRGYNADVVARTVPMVARLMGLQAQAEQAWHGGGQLAARDCAP